MLYKLARPLLFSLDPELAHELTLTALQRGQALGIARWVSKRVDALPVNVMGLKFPNPVGLAAGLDKTAAHIDALGSLGFDHRAETVRRAQRVMRNRACFVGSSQE